MEGLELTDRSGYTHWTTERVRFSDTDAVGHVNNVAYTAYVESGRVAFAFQIAQRVGGGPTGMVLRRLEVDYRRELHFPAELDVGSRLLALGRTSLTIGTGVFHGEHCVATARSVLVLLGDDGPRPIPDDARARLSVELP